MSIADKLHGLDTSWKPNCYFPDEQHLAPYISLSVSLGSPDKVSTTEQLRQPKRLNMIYRLKENFGEECYRESIGST